jgi:ribonuclease R
MLPEALSNDACSLVAGQERLAVTVELELHGADVGRTAFYRSLIRSDERLDYERVDGVFAGSEPASEPWGEPLRAARAAAAALAEARARRASALSIDTSEPEFAFDEDGHVSNVGARVQSESHRVIEHLMIAANEAVARLLAERGVPCLYRVHEQPDPERVTRLIDQLTTLAVPTPPVPARMSRTQAAELLGEISKSVERGRLALTRLVLGALQQAYYAPKNLGHAGLGSSCYCHFTSPIRRYPDLVCHRALLSAIGGGESAPRAGELVELGVWTSERERDAMTIERDADDVARCFALERVLYEGGSEQTFTGEVTGLINAGAFIAFGGAREGQGSEHGRDTTKQRGGSGRERDAGEGSRGRDAGDDQQPQIPPYEGMLPVRRMRAAEHTAGREWWELNELSTILFGERSGATLRLGDRIDVRVDRVDTARGRVDLSPADG